MYNERCGNARILPRRHDESVDGKNEAFGEEL